MYIKQRDLLSPLLCAYLLRSLLSIFNAKACLKMTGTFSSRHKVKLYVIEEDNLTTSSTASRFITLQLPFHQTKKKKKK